MSSDLNISAITGSARLYRDIQKNTEALASGSNLTSADKGAAEIAISNELLGKLAGVQQGMDNLRQGVSMAQAVEGSLEIVSQNLVRMSELATQIQNGTYSQDQKMLLEAEFRELADQNAQIGKNASYNGKTLHQEAQTISISADGQSIDIETQSVPEVNDDLLSKPQAAIESIRAAITATTSYRFAIGSFMDHMKSYVDTLYVKAENVLESQSHIADADIAKTVAEQTSQSIAKMGIEAIRTHYETVSTIASLLYR